MDGGIIELKRALAKGTKDHSWQPIESGFEYVELPRVVDVTYLTQYSAKMRTSYTAIAKQWSSEANTEWIIRHYIAGRFVLAATLLLNSLEFAQKANLKVVVPYLTYYSMLTSGRMLVLTLPNQRWDGGELLLLEHSKAINIVVDAITRVSKELGNNMRSHIDEIKAIREFFSYRFPASVLPLRLFVD